MAKLPLEDYYPAPELVRWAGSYKDAVEWRRLFTELAGDGIGFSVSYHPFRAEHSLRSVAIIETLVKMGVEPPNVFPAELRRYFEWVDEYPSKEDQREKVYKEFWDAILADPYAKAVCDIFHTLDVLWRFYVGNVRDGADWGVDTAIDTQMCIEANMLDLAAAMIDADEAFARNIREFRHKVRADYKKWLTSLKNACSFHYGAFRVGWMMDMIGLETGPLMVSKWSYVTDLGTTAASMR
jgi:hypothetical protein